MINKEMISYIFVIIMSVLISMAITVSAVSLTYNSLDVGYNNETSNLESINVQGAVDELYVKKNNLLTLKNNIDNIESTFLDKAYPVGSIFISTTYTKASDVASAIGGTWEAFGDGRVLRSSTGTSGQTGGKTSVTLVTDNLPSHSHTIAHTHTTPKTDIASSGKHTHTTTAKTLTNPITVSGSQIRWYNMWTRGETSGSFHGGVEANNQTLVLNIPALSVASSGAHTHDVPAMKTDSISTTSSGSTGSGTAFSIENEYITVHMFKRTK